MKRMTRPLMALLTVLLLASPTRAVQDPDDDEEPPVHIGPCSVSLLVDNRGSVTFTISVVLTKPTVMPLAELERKTRELFGESVQISQRHKDKRTMVLSGRAESVLEADGWRTAGTIDLGGIAQVVRPLGVTLIAVHVSAAWTPSRFGGRLPRPQHHLLSTINPAPIEVSLPGPLSELVRPAALLAVVFILPIGFVVWKRHRALAAVDVDASLRWYRFWRWLHGLILAVWIVWLTGISLLGMDALFQENFLGTGEASARATAVRWALMLLPPWLVTIVLNAMAREVYAKLSRAAQTAGEIYRQAAWSVVTTLLPLLLLLSGVFLLFEREFRAGALMILAAAVTRVLAAKLAFRGEDLSPYAVTVGELRDRIFALAQSAGVTLRQLYLVPTGKMPEANAFAMTGGNVMVTDHLVRNLTRRQMDAIVAHELGHLKYHHPGLLLAIFLASVILPVLIAPRFLAMGELPRWLVHLPIGLVIAVLVMYFMSRRFEYQTDSYAAWLTGDPEALITGLIKVHRLSLMPMQWGKWEERLLTHPSTSTRLEAIARHNGISRQRLEEIVANPDPEGEPYPLPAAEISDQVFSTAFRSRVQNRISWTLLSAMLLVPAAAATLAWLGSFATPVRWALLGGGLVFGGLVALALHSVLPLSGYAELRRRLREKLQGQGIDVSGWGGSLVSFAPDASPRLYENYTNWDFGFVFLTNDRFCYVGEQTRFALRREQITKIELGAGMRRWWAVPYLYVSWRDAERGTSGTFNIRAAEVSTMFQLARDTRALEQHLRTWHNQSAAAPETPAPLAELGTPAIGEVTSMPVSSVLSPPALVFQFGFVFAVGAGVSLLIGLPFRFAEGGLGWYVPFAAVLLCVLEALPIWLHREPPPTRAAEQATAANAESSTLSSHVSEP